MSATLLNEYGMVWYDIPQHLQKPECVIGIMDLGQVPHIVIITVYNARCIMTILLIFMDIVLEYVISKAPSLSTIYWITTQF